MDKYNNSFSKVKIKGVLNGLMGFKDSEINRAEHDLKDTGWIVSGEGRKWLTLSKVAWAHWKEIAESIDDWGGGCRRNSKKSGRYSIPRYGCTLRINSQAYKKSWKRSDYIRV